MKSEKPGIRKITRGFQVTLPQEFRERYHLKVGDVVEMVEEDGNLVIRPIIIFRKKISEELDQVFAKADKKSTAKLTDDEAMEFANREIKSVRAEKRKESNPTVE